MFRGSSSDQCGGDRGWRDRSRDRHYHHCCGHVPDHQTTGAQSRLRRVRVRIWWTVCVGRRAAIMDRFWDLQNASRFSLEWILSIDFNSRWRSTLVFIHTLKCWWRRALVRSAESVISPRLRMLLWHQINVNTAHCEHLCNSLQPFWILWLF